MFLWFKNHKYKWLSDRLKSPMNSKYLLAIYPRNLRFYQSKKKKKVHRRIVLCSPSVSTHIDKHVGSMGDPKFAVGVHVNVNSGPLQDSTGAF